MRGYLTTKTFAERTSYSIRTIENLIKSGKLKAHKVNGRWFIASWRVNEVLKRKIRITKARQYNYIKLHVQLDLETYHYYKSIAKEKDVSITKTLSDALHIRFINLTMAHTKIKRTPSETFITE